jgi:hypothetical protein
MLEPKPDKPELNIDDWRLKIYGIATLYLFYSDRQYSFNLQSSIENHQ